jgi:hypothetical protein
LPQHAPPLHATGADAGASTGDFGGPDSDYWIDPTDTSEIQLDPSGSAVEMVLFTVQGQPRPLKTARFRMFRRKTFTFNPSATYQASFLKAAKEALSFRAVPVFPNQPIFARVVFWVRRPSIHFIASTRGPGRLKPRFLDQMDYLPHRSNLTVILGVEHEVIKNGVHRFHHPASTEANPGSSNMSVLVGQIDGVAFG